MSGSYDPGDVYLMRGLGKGAYEAVRGIADKAGVPLVHHPKELAAYNATQKEKQGSDEATHLRVASFGSWPAPVDWDGDGDLDLLIGSFGGEIFLRLNVGTRTKPVYAPESVQAEADGQPLKVNLHAAPVAADWDGDGRWDLVVSSSDGAVAWFKNAGDAKSPRFEAAQELVAPRGKDKFLTQYVVAGEEPSQGVRAQISVADSDGDGRLDLLVGDYSRIVELRKLSASERTAFDQLLREQEELTAKFSGVKADSPESKALTKTYEALTAKLKTYRAGKSDPPTCSFVWLYRRTYKQ